MEIEKREGGREGGREARRQADRQAGRQRNYPCRQNAKTHPCSFNFSIVSFSRILPHFSLHSR